MTTLHIHAATVSIEGTKWHINGSITNPGTPAEGLLMNVRMVNSTFRDASKKEFDVNGNTDNFIAKIPEYANYGVNAFTLNLQGGMPGYEGAVNSAIRKNGELRKNYMDRIKRVIDECDQHDIIIILGIFYQRQDQILQDDDAIRRAVRNVMTWVNENHLTNVVIEIANEYDHNGFDHNQIKTADGEVELIKLAKEIAPNLLVSTSGLGHGRMDENISEVADFLLIHFNGTKVEDIPARIEALKNFNKPIVCNEDDKTGKKAAAALKACVANGCSYGYMNKEINQYQPFEFKGYEDDPIVYDAFKEVTSN
jgi:sugar phosphate isomerase/epimerase